MPKDSDMVSVLSKALLSNGAVLSFNSKKEAESARFRAYRAINSDEREIQKIDPTVSSDYRSLTFTIKQNGQGWDLVISHRLLPTPEFL